MDSISIRQVKPEEFALLSDFGRKTFYETWRAVNTEEDMQLYLQKAFDEKKIAEELRNDKVNTFYFAFENGEIVAYAKLRNDRSYPELEGLKSLEMERIYVLKSHHGKPVGRILMKHCLDFAREEKYDCMWLGVNIDNHRAIAFYKKYGFEIFGSKMFQLGNAMDEDYLMKLML